MELDHLDLSPGRHLQAEIWKRFGLGVNFQGNNGRSEFFLVASIGRCSFRLCADSVACMLQASLGGNPALLNVVRVGDRVFRFSVVFKQVGFFIYNLRSYECQSFKIYFHLWGNGGPQSDREFNQWSNELESEWTLVQRKKKAPSRSYAEAVKFSRNIVLTGAIRSQLRLRKAASR